MFEPTPPLIALLVLLDATGRRHDIGGHRFHHTLPRVGDCLRLDPEPVRVDFEAIAPSRYEETPRPKARYLRVKDVVHSINRHRESYATTVFVEDIDAP